MNKQIGFTLIELIIAIAIVGILAGIAWPAYQENVRTASRADAQGALMGLAQAMEKHFTENGTYEGAATGDADTGVPNIFPSSSPLDGGAKKYNLRITAASQSTYTLRATPINGQAGDGIVELRSSGVRGWDRENDSKIDDPKDMCWNKNC
ncbi:type IV pilin protein [Microbulbifer sp. PSTR4-B]|uniref:type IV pilin protein n=1 Tax=Microbulbifer sp. PSTR4-B TaxID=3243396 RepID=UPI0040397FAD